MYLRWCGKEGVCPASASEQNIRSYLSWLLKRDRQITAIRQLSSIRFFYNYLVGLGLVPGNPTDGVRLKWPKLHPKAPLTDDELRCLLRYADRLRDRAILLVLLSTGCRLGELVAMRTDEIDWRQGVVTVNGKGQRQRMLALGNVAANAVREYLDGRHGWLWLRLDGQGRLKGIGVEWLLKRLARRAGVANVYPHRFRTTFACRFARDSLGDVQSLQVLMGHSKIETTLHYAAYVATERALAQQRRFSLADRVIGSASC